MKHLGTQTLETPRLILRRLRPEDAPAMLQNWCGDPEVTAFLSWPTHPDVETTAQVLADWIPQYEKQDYYQWGITLKEEGDQPVGTIAAVEVSDAVEMVQIGYCIGRPWWGRGLMSEALGAVIRFFFERVGVKRVYARHDPRNPASGAVMRKNGMRLEGTLRQADRNNQGIADMVVYGILAEDLGKISQTP